MRKINVTLLQVTSFPLAIVKLVTLPPNVGQNPLYVKLFWHDV